MKTDFMRAFLVAAMFVGACAGLPQQLALLHVSLAQELPVQLFGRVQQVVDGDTIRMSGEKIRLDGIDAPERDQIALHRGRAVNQGAMASRALAEKLGRREVRVDIHERGHYGRLIGTVFLGGRDINREMVNDGLAWAAYGNQYQAEQRQAQQARRGIWAHEGTVAPRQWRKSKAGN